LTDKLQSVEVALKDAKLEKKDKQRQIDNDNKVMGSMQAEIGTAEKTVATLKGEVVDLKGQISQYAGKEKVSWILHCKLDLTYWLCHQSWNEKRQEIEKKEIAATSLAGERLVSLLICAVYQCESR
jgi:hypothetical protein